MDVMIYCHGVRTIAYWIMGRHICGRCGKPVAACW